MFLSARFIVTDTVDTPLVGHHLMEENECCWMFGKSCFTVHSISIPLISKPSDCANECQLYTREAVDVPANHVV